MTTIRLAALAALFAAACGQTSAPAQTAVDAAPIAGSLFAATPSQQWRLPAELREVSGLALSADGRLFAHADERAIIHELDAGAGRIVKSFSVGDPERGDFEGLAITPDVVFWLVTSTGQLLRFQEGANGARVGFQRFDTGLGETCEIEGLAFLAAAESLILACKENHARDMRETIVLHQWRQGAGAQVWRSLSEREIAQIAGVERFRPSSVELDAQTGRILLLSARDNALAELDSDGALRSARRLDYPHGQAEGLSVLANGRLAIADEGGDARALLSLYDRVP